MEHLTPELPPQDITILSVVPVGEQAAQGLFGYGEENCRVYDEERHLDALSEQHYCLYLAMDTLCEEWGFEDEEIDYFRYGFALTYAAITNQAELSDIPLEDINDTTLEAVTGNIQISDDRGLAYVKNSLRVLERSDTHLTQVWLDYLQTQGQSTGGVQGTAFIAGGILAHDLIREQINHTEMLDNYQYSYN